MIDLHSLFIFQPKFTFFAECFCRQIVLVYLHGFLAGHSDMVLSVASHPTSKDCFISTSLVSIHIYYDTANFVLICNESTINWMSLVRRIDADWMHVWPSKMLDLHCTYYTYNYAAIDSLRMVMCCFGTSENQDQLVNLQVGWPKMQLFISRRGFVIHEVHNWMNWH